MPAGSRRSTKNKAVPRGSGWSQQDWPAAPESALVGGNKFYSPRVQWTRVVALGGRRVLVPYTRLPRLPTTWLRQQFKRLMTGLPTHCSCLAPQLWLAEARRHVELRMACLHDDGRRWHSASGRVGAPLDIQPPAAVTRRGDGRPSDVLQLLRRGYHRIDTPATSRIWKRLEEDAEDVRLRRRMRGQGVWLQKGWLAAQFRQLGAEEAPFHLQGREPELYVQPTRRWVVLRSMEEDGGPDDFFINEGPLNGQLVARGPLNVGTEARKYSEAALLKAGFVRVLLLHADERAWERVLEASLRRAEAAEAARNAQQAERQKQQQRKGQQRKGRAVAGNKRGRPHAS